MIEHEADYCTDCNAIWPKGQVTCIGCGFVSLDESAAATDQDGGPSPRNATGTPSRE